MNLLIDLDKCERVNNITTLTTYYYRFYCVLLYTRRKTFTHEKREQVGMDLVRSTEANRNHTSMHVIINSIILTPAILYTNIATICTSIYYTVHAYFFQTKL